VHAETHPDIMRSVSTVHEIHSGVPILDKNRLLDTLADNHLITSKVIINLHFMSILLLNVPFQSYLENSHPCVKLRIWFVSASVDWSRVANKD
jgi:hypothetical protein